MSHAEWTAERVEALKQHWAEGLSASQTARRLGGVSRNAVIGKVHRLGLAGRAAGGTVSRPRAASRPSRPPRPRVPRIAAPRLRPVEPAPVVAEPEGPGLVSCMTALHAHICKWPIGDPKAADFSFCGHPVDGDGPYCAGHDRKAHRPGELAPLTRDPLVRRVLAGLAA